MENNFIQMAASAGHAVVYTIRANLADHAVAYTIGGIFKHITDCVQLCIWPMALRILFFNASIVSGLSA